MFRELLTFNTYWLNLSYQIQVGFIFVYQKSLKWTFKLVFEYKITYLICVLVLWIHKDYCVVKKLLWNVCIIALWYRKGKYIRFLHVVFEHWDFSNLYGTELKFIKSFMLIRKHYWCFYNTHHWIGMYTKVEIWKL